MFKRVLQILFGQTAKMRSIEDEYFAGFLKLNIEKLQRENMKKYCVLMLVVIIAIACSAFVQRTDSVQIREKSGCIYVKRPDASEGPKRVLTKMTISNSKESISRQMELDIKPENYMHPQSKSIAESDDKNVFELTAESDMRRINRDISNGNSGKWIALPMSVNENNIDWEIVHDKKTAVWIIILGVIGFQFIFLTRFSSAKNAVELAKASIAEDLPDFVNKIALLLNAGLILNEAIERNLDNRARLGEKAHPSFFYDSISEIYKRSICMNRVFSKELLAFAKTSGDKNFNRISNILYENLNKGTILSGKLEAEAENMWFEKRKNMERSGRISETKLTVPLSMLLMVLLVITAAPALLVL